MMRAKLGLGKYAKYKHIVHDPKDDIDGEPYYAMTPNHSIKRIYSLVHL
jgi:hypothetical protein